MEHSLLSYHKENLLITEINSSLSQKTVEELDNCVLWSYTKFNIILRINDNPMLLDRNICPRPPPTHKIS